MPTSKFVDHPEPSSSATDVVRRNSSRRRGRKLLSMLRCGFQTRLLCTTTTVATSATAAAVTHRATTVHYEQSGPLRHDELGSNVIKRRRVTSDIVTADDYSDDDDVYRRRELVAVDSGIVVVHSTSPSNTDVTDNSTSGDANRRRRLHRIANTDAVSECQQHRAEMCAGLVGQRRRKTVEVESEVCYAPFQPRRYSEVPSVVSAARTSTRDPGSSCTEHFRGELKVRIDLEKDKRTVASRVDDVRNVDIEDFGQLLFEVGLTSSGQSHVIAAADERLSACLNETLVYYLRGDDVKKRLQLSVFVKYSHMTELIGCMSFGVENLIAKSSKANHQDAAAAAVVDGWHYILSEELGSRKHLQVFLDKENNDVHSVVQDTNTVRATSIQRSTVDANSRTPSADTAELVQLSCPPSAAGYGFTIRGRGPVEIARVKSRGPASDAGLHPGDQIVAVNGVDVRRSTLCRVAQLVRSSVDEGRVVVGVVRCGQSSETGRLRRRISDTGYGSSMQENVTGSGFQTTTAMASIVERTLFDRHCEEDCWHAVDAGNTSPEAAVDPSSRLSRMESFRLATTNRKSLRKGSKMAAVVEERTTTTTVSRTHLATGVYFRWDDPDDVASMYTEVDDDVTSGGSLNEARLESHVYEELHGEVDAAPEVERLSASIMDSNNNHSEGSLLAVRDLERQVVDPERWSDVTSRFDDVSCQLFPSPIRPQSTDESTDEFVRDVVYLEQLFVDDMTTGLLRYSRPLRHNVVTPAQHAQLFQNVEKLVALSEFHVRRMSEVVTSPAADQSEASLLLSRLVSTYSMRLAAFCDAYATYLAGLDSSLQLLNQLRRRNAQFAGYIDMMSSTSSSLSLVEFLTSPRSHLDRLSTCLRHLLDQLTTRNTLTVHRDSDIVHSLAAICHDVAVAVTSSHRV